MGSWPRHNPANLAHNHVTLDIRTTSHAELPTNITYAKDKSRAKLAICNMVLSLQCSAFCAYQILQGRAALELTTYYDELPASPIARTSTQEELPALEKPCFLIAPISLVSPPIRPPAFLTKMRSSSSSSHHLTEGHPSNL